MTKVVVNNTDCEDVAVCQIDLGFDMGFPFKTDLYHSHILHMQFTTVTLSIDEMLISVARCWLKKQPNVLIKQAQITP